MSLTIDCSTVMEYFEEKRKNLNFHSNELPYFTIMSCIFETLTRLEVNMSDNSNISKHFLQIIFNLNLQHLEELNLDNLRVHVPNTISNLLNLKKLKIYSYTAEDGIILPDTLLSLNLTSIDVECINDVECLLPNIWVISSLVNIRITIWTGYKLPFYTDFILPNLKSLYFSFNHGDLYDLNLNNYPNIETLIIDSPSGINFGKHINLPNLKYLLLNQEYEDDCLLMNLDGLYNSTKLEKLLIKCVDDDFIEICDHEFPSVKKLECYYSPELSSNIVNFTNLIKLYLTGVNSKIEFLANLENLEQLTIQVDKDEQDMPFLFPKINKLETLKIIHCSNKEFPFYVIDTFLTVSNVSITTYQPQFLQCFPNIRKLDFCGINIVNIIGQEIFYFRQLNKIIFRNGIIFSCVFADNVIIDLLTQNRVCLLSSN